jgi:hypothetical protein
VLVLAVQIFGIIKAEEPWVTKGTKTVYGRNTLRNRPRSQNTFVSISNKRQFGVNFAWRLNQAIPQRMYIRIWRRLHKPSYRIMIVSIYLLSLSNIDSAQTTDVWRSSRFQRFTLFPQYGINYLLMTASTSLVNPLSHLSDHIFTCANWIYVTVRICWFIGNAGEC